MYFQNIPHKALKNWRNPHEVSRTCLVKQQCACSGVSPELAINTNKNIAKTKYFKQYTVGNLAVLQKTYITIKPQ